MVRNLNLSPISYYDIAEWKSIVQPENTASWAQTYDMLSNTRCPMTAKTRRTENKRPVVKSTDDQVVGVSRGDDVRESDVQRLANEAETGYSVKQLRSGPGRPAIGSAAADVVPVRLDPELRKAIAKLAKRENKTTSEIVRKALRRYVA